MIPKPKNLRISALIKMKYYTSHKTMKNLIEFLRWLTLNIHKGLLLMDIKDWEIKKREKHYDLYLDYDNVYSWMSIVFLG